MRLLSCMLVGCVLISARPCQAQGYATDRGVWSVGGTARFTHQNDVEGGEGLTILDLNPRLSYFIVRGLALSVNLQFARLSSGGDVSKGYGIGPGATYYFIRRQTTLAPFISARTLYTQNRLETEGFPSITADSFTWLVSGGLALFLARNAAITGELFYTRQNLSAEFGDSDVEEYGTQFGVAVYLY